MTRTVERNRSRRRPIALAAGLLVLTLAVPAHAALVVSVESTIVNAGSTGEALDVLLSNTGPDAVDLNGFSFGLTLDQAINVTAINTGTGTPYLFNGHSEFGPDISLSLGTSPEASDVYDVPGGSTVLASGASAGLGHVVFNVSPTASGSYSVTLNSYPDTSLSLNSTDIPILALINGTITVLPVPEPSSIVLIAVGGLLALGRRKGRREASRSNETLAPLT